MDSATLNTLLSLPVGTAIIVLGLKYLLPRLKSSTSTFVEQNEASSKFLNKTIEERDKALVRADAADERAERYFTELAEMKTQVQLLTWQLQIANEKIDVLTGKMDKLARGESA